MTNCQFHWVTFAVVVGLSFVYERYEPGGQVPLIIVTLWFYWPGLLGAWNE